MERTYLQNIEIWGLHASTHPYQNITRLTIQHPGADARRQLLQALEEILNLILLDVAKIRHQVCNLASRIGHLLVDVVVEQDVVDYISLAFPYLGE